MFRTIDTAMWSDPKIRKLPPDGKLLFLYLITNSHAHVSGIYYLPLNLVTHETGLKVCRINTLYHTLSENDLAIYDEAQEVIWVKKMLDRQGPGARNAVSAAVQLRNLHNCNLINDFLSFYSHRNIPYQYPMQTLSRSDNPVPVPVPVLVNKEKGGVGEKENKTIPPPLELVQAYCEERKNQINPQQFIDYYQARGWKYQKGQPVKDWQAAIRTWERNQKDFTHGNRNTSPGPGQRHPADNRTDTF